MRIDRAVVCVRGNEHGDRDPTRPGGGRAVQLMSSTGRRGRKQAGPDRGHRQLEGSSGGEDGLPVPGISAIGASAACPALEVPCSVLACPVRRSRPGLAMHFPMSGELVPGPSFGSFVEVGKFADRRTSRPVRCFRFFAQTPEIGPICAGSAPETASHVELRAVRTGNHPRTQRERRHRALKTRDLPSADRETFSARALSV